MTLLLYLELLDLLGRLSFGYIALGGIVWILHLLWWAGIYANSKKED